MLWGCVRIVFQIGSRPLSALLAVQWGSAALAKQRRALGGSGGIDLVRRPNLICEQCERMLQDESTTHGRRVAWPEKAELLLDTESPGIVVQATCCSRSSRLFRGVLTARLTWQLKHCWRLATPPVHSSRVVSQGSNGTARTIVMR